MTELSPLVLFVSDPTYPTRRPSVIGRRASRLTAGRLRSAGGDGASRDVMPDSPRVAVADRTRSESEAWCARLDAARSEAQAALRVPFNRPVTWQP